MSHRLYLTPPLTPGAQRALDSQDAHYLVRVLRLKPGAELRCFDGRGSEWLARLTRSSARAGAVEIGELVRSQPKPEPALHLAQGWLKGQAMDHTVQKATELGASDFWPISTERSNVKLDDDRVQSRMRHWQRIARSATEQSERLYLPSVHPPRTLTDFLGDPPCRQLLFLEPGREPLPVDLPVEPLALLVGPEGGWTATECAMAEARNARLHGLGNFVLRAETVPLAALAAVRHGWGWG